MRSGTYSPDYRIVTKEYNGLDGTAGVATGQACPAIVPSLFPGRLPGEHARQGNSSMSNREIANLARQVPERIGRLGEEVVAAFQITDEDQRIHRVQSAE